MAKSKNTTEQAETTKSKAPATTPKAEAPVKAAPKAKAPKQEPKGTTRIKEAALALYGAKKGTTVEDLVKAANAAYIKAGGDDNLKEAKWAIRVAAGTMEALSLIVVADGAVEVIGKIVAK